MARTTQYSTRLATTPTETVEITCNDMFVRFPVPTLEDIRRHISNPRMNGSTQAIGDFLIFRTFFSEQISQERVIVSAEVSSLSSELWRSADVAVKEKFRQLAAQTMSMFRSEVPLIWPK